MNGALIDASFTLFFKLKYNKLYDAVLATPVTPVDMAVGEITWALVRGVPVLRVVHPRDAADGADLVLVGAARAAGRRPDRVHLRALGTACTTFMRSWQDFELHHPGALPLFLFSATFYPLSAYPESLQWVVRCSPLYHSATLLRELTTGTVGAGSFVHAAVLLGLGLVGVLVTGRRLERLLLT